MLHPVFRSHRKILAVGLSLTGFLLSAPRHAWAQG
jgi:hypothetical protein